MKLKCIIVDDEPRAIEVLADYVQQLSILDLIASFRNPVEAIDFLKKTEVDVVFLDINMPMISGIQFIKTLTHKPAIVLTTAYSEYAIESYELKVADYLLKPIEFDRFIACVNRLYDNLQTTVSPPKDPTIVEKGDSDDFLFLKHGTKIERIDYEDILYIEGSGNYLTYHLAQKKIMALGKMSTVLDILPTKRFARVHKSYIVHINKIESIENNHIHIGRDMLSISQTYRSDFYDRIKDKLNTGKD